ncbi:hypothetical protein PV327_002828 [Microctonus hyperodae]|uniref:Uncharacterized protein n=1 Tax=Microctonus hyperodae TaxID=165561 RepID=A0AA39FGC2_MICHY|nr:hypothetical protein PV327_002828 [Microctonus hyperodae]
MKRISKFRINHLVLGTLLTIFLIVPTFSTNDVTNSHVSIHNTKQSTTNDTLLKPQGSNVTIDKHTHDKNIKGSDTTAKIPNKDTTANITDVNKVIKKINPTVSSETLNHKPHNHSPELDSGAVTRAFYVFIGLSVIIVSYMVFRSFRLRSSPAQMVRKYGVLAHKQDIEMRPLPLDDDDDDDTTVFDASKLPLHSHQTA